MTPGVLPSLDDVVEKGLRKDKNRRYKSATDLAQAVLSACGLEGSVSKWAQTAESEIEAALHSATPKDPKPFGAQSEMPDATASQAPAASSAATRTGDASRPSDVPIDGMLRPAWRGNSVGLALAAAAVVCGVVVTWLLLQ